VGSMLEQRRPILHAISVMGQAQIRLCSKLVSCVAYLMPRHYHVQSVAFRPSHIVCGPNQKPLLCPTSSSLRR
ncbi:hypothetical protein HAX54_015342, partial [Datura stramonium]|nr:hypothetical protein [Datura stramonium]